MAEQHDHHLEEKRTEEVPVETTDRGLFDFLGKKKDDGECAEIKKPDHHVQEEEVIVTEFEKVRVSEPEPKVEEHKEEEKHESLLEKLQRSDSTSSSSSSDEEEGKEKKEKKDKKKKKGLKEEKKEEKHEEDTSVPIEKYEEEAAVAQPEEKKGFIEKIKEKLPGQHKKTEEVVVATPPPAPVMVECYAAEESHQEGGPEADQPKEKKGFLEKIKEKIPGYHPKTASPSEEEKEKEKD